jgi:hypothetical protein
MPLDLLVPDLCAPADAPATMRELRLPALEKWLARSEMARETTTRAYDWLAAAFGLPSPAPVAPVSLAAESGAREGAWLRADPVHVRIESDRTALHPAAVLGIARQEADALVAALQAHFRGDGLEFVSPSPERWYVQVPAGEMPATRPLEEALAGDAQKMLPASRGSMNWPGALTEAQMILSTHEVNTRRERERRPAINSVWFWGGGEMPGHVASPYAAVFSDDVFARGLASLSGAHIGGAVDSLAAVPMTSSAEESVLVVLDELSTAILHGDAARWVESARDMERAWFEGLGDAIRRFGSVRVVLPAPGGVLVARLDGAARWRWFRSRRPLATYA